MTVTRSKKKERKARNNLHNYISFCDAFLGNTPLATKNGGDTPFEISIKIFYLYLGELSKCEKSEFELHSDMPSSCLIGILK